MSVRTQTADRGIRLLKKGTEATLHERGGRAASRYSFTLSENETTLSWTRRGSLLGSGRRSLRSLRLSEVVEVIPCDTAFRARNIRGSVMPAAPNEGLHLTLLTLLLLRALPSTPSAEVLDCCQQKEMIDLSFEDEETFGLWIAALRALQAVWPEGRPVRLSSGRDAADKPRPGAGTLPGVALALHAYVSICSIPKTHVT